MNPTAPAANDVRTALEEAAERRGIEPTFWDIWGKQHNASAETLAAILKSLGAEALSGPEKTSSPEEPDAIELVPRTLVLSIEDPSFPIAIPPSSRDVSLALEIVLEDGRRRETVMQISDLHDAPSANGAEADSHQKIVALDNQLPMGYHTLTATLGTLSSSARIIISPERVHQPAWLEHARAAGLVISLYGLRSRRNWGCGDCTDLLGFIDYAASVGVSFVGLNPLHSIANRQPYNTSPYLPNSIFFRNHIYLDIERIPEFQNSECARHFLKSPARLAEIQALRDSEFVEYEKVSRLKLRMLNVLYREFLREDIRNGTERAQAFHAYVDREGELLHLFALHAALDQALHRSYPDVWNWRDWPHDFQQPDSQATRDFANAHPRSIGFHKYIQWQLDQQFRDAQAYALSKGLSIGLYHDMALATDNHGGDLWAHRSFYVSGCRVGSPPDNFSPKGQDWGFPPPNSRAHFEDGYRLFAEAIRKATAHGGALRIDHAMRFFRLYWIPDGMDATQGTYVRDRFEDLIRVLALESVRGKFMVIGEDLGTVPDLVRETLAKFGVLSYRLLYFEQDKAGEFRRPDEYPRQALVSPTTHDLPTLAGFWQGADIEARRAAGIFKDDSGYRQALEERTVQKQKLLNTLQELRLLPVWFPGDVREVPELTGELHNAMIGFLAHTPSMLLAINQEDLFKDAGQQNLPGTTAEHPNWRHKMRFAIEDLQGGATRGYTGMLRGWIERTGRTDPSRKIYMK